MKLNRFKLNSQRGQSLVLIAISMIVMVAMAALILDGGLSYMNRRAAQAAADAGALAGAGIYCADKSATGAAINQAEHYATVENKATTASATIESGNVVVVTTVHQNSFFANIFGISQADIGARASAGCYHPVGEGLIPIAWSCDVIPPDPDDPHGLVYCEHQASLPWSVLEPLVKGTTGSVEVDGEDVPLPFEFQGDDYLPDHLSIIMNSDKQCFDDDGFGEINCDLDGDGRTDVFGGAERGWLYLDSGAAGGSAELEDWIENGYPGIVRPNTWLAGKPGADTAVFYSVDDLIGSEGRVVLIPVFGGTCDVDPEPKPECYHNAHAIVDLSEFPETFPIVSNDQTYYHVIGFVPFFITCVDSSSRGPCPGHDAAVAVENGIKDNVATVEGYFVTGYSFPDAPISSGGLDLGVYTISLNE